MIRNFHKNSCTCWNIVCWNPTETLNSLKQIYQTGPSPPVTPVHGTSWTINCQIGYRWADDTFFHTINCTNTNWTSFPVACIRMILMFHNSNISGLEFYDFYNF